MSIKIKNIPTREQYEASAGQTLFNVPFPFYKEEYLRVYQRGENEEPNNITQLLTLGTDYTTSGEGSENGGSITLTSGATLKDVITIFQAEPVDRTSVFDDLNQFSITMNQQLNDLTIMVKQLETFQDELIPKYRYDELVSDDVREGNLELPILNDGYIWIGRGNKGDSPDDIQAQAIGNFDSLGLLSADYVVGTAQPGLSNEQTLGGMGTGIMYSTDDGTTGTVSTLDVGTGLEVSGGALNVTSSSGNVDGPISQANTFTHGDVVYFDGNDFELALADDKETAEVYGLITDPDSSQFDIHLGGVVDLTGARYTPLTPGHVYFLSDLELGILTPVPPEDVGTVRKPLLIAKTETSGNFQNWLGIEITGSENSGGGGGTTNEFPVSHMAFFSANSVPSGYLKADGSAVSRTTYADLFASIGTDYGSGDGSSTFNLPDLRGQFLRGLDDGRGLDSGRAFASNQTDAMEKMYGFTSSIATAQGSPKGPGVDAFEKRALHAIQLLNGGSRSTNDVIDIDLSRQIRTDDETRPTNVAMMPCIKY